MTLDDINRRQMLVRAAATAAALGLAVSITTASRRAEAKVSPPESKEADSKILNQLLAAEYDAIATYTAGVGIINNDMVTPAATKKIVSDVAAHFQAQHIQHAAALRKMIEDDGGTPAADSMKANLPASFPAATAKTTEVMKLAADKEKHAASAYVEVMKSISTPAAAKLVASIGGVETQHFVVLYLLVEGLISANSTTASMPALVVPAAFVLNVGGGGTLNLETFPDLDNLLKLDAKP